MSISLFFGFCLPRTRITHFLCEEGAWVRLVDWVVDWGGGIGRVNHGFGGGREGGYGVSDGG